MNPIKNTTLTAAAMLTLLSANADRVFYLPMEPDGNMIKETVSNNSYAVEAANIVERANGAKGCALRLDGYSNYINADIALGTLSSFTVSLWSAMETWPIIEHDVQNETESTCIVGNYDAAEKKGFGFFVTRTGKLSFKFYTQSWPGEIIVSDPLPLYQWNNLVATCDGKKVTLYNNGVALGSANCKGVAFDGTLMLGKSAEGRKMGQFCLSTINGIIDELEIYNEAIDASIIQGWKAEAEPVLTNVAEGRYDNDLMRPIYHGMPSRNWTNETHGLVYYNDKYHLFFQKNANGPYMSRLQWGHLVSDNLYEWSEMPIAIGSDRWYDLKGCWSGCIAVDDVVTGGKPNIIYTGVDYARAMIGQAEPTDDGLLAWSKPANPIIDGRPSGLSDDFRDPFFFRNGDDAYIIVGTSKDGKGACTLHKYNPVTRMWSNDGQIFYSASNASTQGTFWEMPNLTKIGDKWLFTVTPLGMNSGVKAMYWVGTINADGTFNATSTASTIELPGLAKDGYGLLSPSIIQVDGKTIAIGIVPDKLASSYNYDLGWAHTYSLPREWVLADNGQLIQKPYSGLEAMRKADSKVSMDLMVDGCENVIDMNDRRAEVIGEFTVGDAAFGLAFYSNYADGAKLYYTPSTGNLTLDMRGLSRWVNDGDSFNGLYTTTLPTTIAKGSVMKMHVFVDHSIMDIFINDMWATSIRLFPTENAAEGVQVYTEGGATQAKIQAWAIAPNAAGISDVIADKDQTSEYVDVYNTMGVLVRSHTPRNTALINLPKGLYIVDGKKIFVK